MKIKKYTGETIQDVIFKVKADLGPEAIIIDKRKFKKGGIFGFFGRTVVEVLAALEEKGQPQYKLNDKNRRKNRSRVKEDIPDRPGELLDKDSSLKEKTSDMQDLTSKTEEKAFLKDNLEKNNLNKEEIKKENPKKNNILLENIKKNKSTREELVEKNKENKNETSGYKNNRLYKYLYSQGVEENYLNIFISKLNKSAGFPLKDGYKERVKSFSKKYFADSSPIKIDRKPKVISFIGPTGVGKTTTIAKIAAYFAVDKNKKVGLITADTYRIAAVEQLQTYSNIIDIPFKVCYSSSKLESMIKGKFKNCDLIFIDTPGSSWKDQLQLGRLKDYTENEIIDEVHLLVSLNTKSRDLYNIIERFEKMNPDKILLTKLDETNSYGDLINLKERYSLPFSYLTFGQDVPEDINPAEPEILFKYLFGDYNA